MTREEAIQVLNTYDVNFDEYRAEEIAEAIDMAIEALSADAVSREPLDIFAQMYRAERESLPSADAEPTVIRSRTLLPTKDFKEWAKRIREVNPNAVVIPCDAEVVSADAVQGEWIRKEKEYNDCDGYRAYYWHECSECGAKPPKNAWKQECFSPYCPNCGARMENKK